LREIRALFQPTLAIHSNRRLNLVVHDVNAPSPGGQTVLGVRPNPGGLAR
jgi:hypothetical protein